MANQQQIPRKGSMTREEPPPGMQVYLAGPTDTLATVALKHDMSTQELAEVNRLNRNAKLYLGQALFVKAKPDADASTKSSEKSRQKLIPSPFSPTKVNVLQVDVKYCVGALHVNGTLIATPDYLIFDPKPEDPIAKERGTADFFVNIELRHVNDCMLMPAEGLQGEENMQYIEVLYSKGKEGKLLHFLVDNSKIDDVYLQLTTFINHSLRSVFYPVQLSGSNADASSSSATSTATAVTASSSPPKASTSPTSATSPANNPLTLSAGDKPASPTPGTALTSSSSTPPAEPEVFIPKLFGGSLLLTDDALAAITSHLPARYKHNHWVLLYSTQEHGISMNTFYSRVNNKGATVLVVKDKGGYIFGAFVTDSWVPTKGFRGGGESFLFGLVPVKKFYHWTGNNNFIMSATEHYIAVGAGGGKYGLWLDSDFLQGHSGPCEAFGNDVLASAQDFTCVILEVWGFVSSHSRQSLEMARPVIKK